MNVRNNLNFGINRWMFCLFGPPKTSQIGKSTVPQTFSLCDLSPQTKSLRYKDLDRVHVITVSVLRYEVSKQVRLDQYLSS